MQKFISLIISASTLLLSGCAQHYDFKSNLDRNKITDYFSVNKVKIYPSVESLPAQHQYIGLVEGQDCQKKDYLAAPDPVNARSEARRKAYKIQGNAIVFSACTTVETKQCVQQLICYGQAYKVKQK